MQANVPQPAADDDDGDDVDEGRWRHHRDGFLDVFYTVFVFLLFIHMLTVVEQILAEHFDSQCQVHFCVLYLIGPLTPQSWKSWRYPLRGEVDPVGVMSQRTPALQTTYSTSSEAFLLNKDDILNVHILLKQRRYFNPSFCKIIEADILCNKYF